jgi:hypothetical protein
MFQITVISTSPNTPPVGLFFKTKESADIAHKNIYEAQKGTLPVQVLKTEDDFGAILTIDKERIAYAVSIDGEKQAALMNQKNSKIISES